MGKLKNHCGSNKNRSRGIRVKRDPIKVTYISSPMMVKASNACEFRAIVQELTGKNSDVSSDHDVVSTTTLSNEEESIHLHHHHQQAVDQHIITSTTAADHHHDDHDYLMDDAFSKNIIMSLLDDHHQFDERFLWKEIVSAECGSFEF